MEALEASEDLITKRVLKEVNSIEFASGPYIKQIKPADGLEVTAAVMTAAHAAAQGGAVRVKHAEANGAGFEATVPQSALKELAGDKPVVFMSTSLPAQLVDIINTSRRSAYNVSSPKLQPPSLETKPFAFSVFDMEGKKIKFQMGFALSDPILLTTSTNSSADVDCAFWNASTARWSTEGVSRVMFSNGSLTCSTTHLSIFGGVLQTVGSDFVKALTCQNAVALFSKDAAVAILEIDRWAQEVPSIVFLATLLLLPVCVAIGLYYDYKWMAEAAAVRQSSVRASSVRIFRSQDEPWEHLIMIFHILVQSVVRGPVAKLIFLLKSLPQFRKDPARVLSYVLNSAQAYESGLSSSTFDVVTKEFELRGSISHRRGSTAFQVALRTVQSKIGSLANKMKVVNRTFSGMRVYRRILWISKCFHPWLACLCYDLAIPRVAYVAAMACEILTCAALCVVYEDMSGSSVNGLAYNPEECNPEGGWVGEALNSFMKGFVSCLLSEGLVAIILDIRKRAGELLSSDEDLDDKQQAVNLFMSGVFSLFFWTCLGLQSIISSYVCLAYLATVNITSSFEWAKAFGWSLLERALFEPVGMGIIFGLAISFVTWRWPAAFEQVQAQRASLQEHVEDQEISRMNSLEFDTRNSIFSEDAEIMVAVTPTTRNASAPELGALATEPNLPGMVNSGE